MEEIATEVGILYDGELVAEGAPDELKDRMEAGGESTLKDVFLEVTTDDAYEVDESPSDTGACQSA